jgi:hypothetical protein
VNDALKGIVIRLRDNQYKNEEHLRLGAVYRLLNELGWDVWNPQEVCTEFQAIRRKDDPAVSLADCFLLCLPIRLLLLYWTDFLEATEICVRNWNTMEHSFQPAGTD